MLGLILMLPLAFAQAPAGGGEPAKPAAPPAITTPAPTPTPAATTPAVTAPAAGQPGTPPAAPGPGGAAQPPVNPLVQFLPLLPMVAIFYFLMIRPQQQQERKRKEMINSVERNARVITSAGMYGTVVSVDKERDIVVLRLGADPGLKVEFSRASIVRVLDGSDKDKDKKDA